MSSTYPPSASVGVPRSLVGIDLVQISRIAESCERFGERFLRRIFTADEIAYAASSTACCHERLAARFAAKEAALKALQMTVGVPWTHIEVKRNPDGLCELHLHGSAAEAARRRGVESLSLSMSHEGDYATAVVVAQQIVSFSEAGNHL